jgi:hypothetical protein
MVYLPGASPLHRLPAGIKLAALALAAAGSLHRSSSAGDSAGDHAATQKRPVDSRAPDGALGNRLGRGADPTAASSALTTGQAGAAAVGC